MFTEFINTEFDKYCEKAYELTCENIDTDLENHKKNLTKFADKQIGKITEEFLGSITTNKVTDIIEKMIEERFTELHDKIANNIVNSRFQDIVKQTMDKKLIELEKKLNL